MAGSNKRKNRKWAGRIFAVLLLLALTALLPRLQRFLAAEKVIRMGQLQVPQWVDVQLIGIDGDSRRGEKLEDVRGIVIHYVGNPETTARQNRDYYANPASEVSSHFLVGLDGEIIQCVPLDEKSSASNHRNRDTISIEVCHPDSTGKFSDVTYDALVKLTAWLLEVTGMDETDVIRHYDITGKECPRYYVIHEEAWQTLLEDIARAARERRNEHETS